MTAPQDRLSAKETIVPSRRRLQSSKIALASSRKHKTHDESLVGLLCAWLVEHQVGISVNLLLLLTLAHLCLPRARRQTRKFFEMSYLDQSTHQYNRGYDDVYFVLFWIVVFTGGRAAAMEYILKPLASLGGVSTRKGRNRFAEQAWLVFYYSISWAMGMYIYMKSDYWQDRREIWSNFPTPLLAPLMKWYYLVQFAFWLQQLFVVNIEERRKDHWQMFTHHVFTSLLIFASYGFYQTRVGNVILCLMDVADILLPFAKILKYLHFGLVCDIAFAVFLAVWFVARHVLYLQVCWSIAVELPSIMEYGCYSSSSGQKISNNGGSAIFSNIMQPFNDPNGIVCFNPYVRNTFLSLLLSLQVLIMIWFGMILRVAYGVVIGKGAHDSRSDDEAEEEAEDDELEYYEEDMEAAYLEEEVSAEDLHFLPTRARSTVRSSEGSSSGNGVVTGSPRTRSIRSAARTTAISIPGHGDHKELLGRIGCDKPS